MEQSETLNAGPLDPVVSRRSNIQDTTRLNWLIANTADVEAPEDGESYTWVIYTKGNSLGAGAGCHRNLRTAIDIAMRKGESAGAQTQAKTLQDAPQSSCSNQLSGSGSPESGDHQDTSERNSAEMRASSVMWASGPPILEGSQNRRTTVLANIVLENDRPFMERPVMPNDTLCDPAHGDAGKPKTL
jgi:hypothetical protein